MSKRIIPIVICAFIMMHCELYAEEEVWDSMLDTARKVDYLSPVEKDIILELNKARSNPKRYAETYIKPRLQYFSGTNYAVPGQTVLLSWEGAAAVQACIDTLSKMAPIPTLTPEKGLCMAARDLAKDQAGGGIGHYGSDGSDPFNRMNRYGSWTGTAGENVAYGPTAGREIIIQLLIDDGVPDRGHLKNNMSKDYKKIGVAFGIHKTYGSVAVIDFASGYTNK